MAVVLLFAPRRRLRLEERGTNVLVRYLPWSECVPSYGSLKTEEKTECQCGQF